MHTGHDSSAADQWPLIVAVDLSSVYPNGLALNQLQWETHHNGFGTYEVQAKDTGGSWVTLSSEHMNGYGSGLDENRVHTDAWSNDVRYTQYRVKIMDCDNSGRLCGWAVYSWQWNRV